MKFKLIFLVHLQHLLTASSITRFSSLDVVFDRCCLYLVQTAPHETCYPRLGPAKQLVSNLCGVDIIAGPCAETPVCSGDLVTGSHLYLSLYSSSAHHSSHYWTWVDFYQGHPARKARRDMQQAVGRSLVACMKYSNTSL